MKHCSTVILIVIVSKQKLSFLDQNSLLNDILILQKKYSNLLIK